jgi:putative SOS response-associated peptidase YedK
VAGKPAFREAFRRRRGLIPANGFFEWKKKRPYHFRLRDGRPFAFTGLWERWQGQEGPVESCAILTTNAKALVRPVHDCMPVILDRQDFERWLDPAGQEVAGLGPYREDEMMAAPVGPWVNDPRHEGPQCLEPLS